jgi:hypothetical protein
MLSDGTTSANRIAEWDGVAWRAVGATLPNYNATTNGIAGDGRGGTTVGVLSTLQEYNGVLYVGGTFTTLGDGTVRQAICRRGLPAGLAGTAQSRVRGGKRRPAAPSHVPPPQLRRRNNTPLRCYPRHPSLSLPAHAAVGPPLCGVERHSVVCRAHGRRRQQRL